MSDADTPYSDSGTPRVWCRHLLLCRNVWFDPARMDDGFSLGKLLVQVRPAEGESYPVEFPRLFGFLQLTGTIGDYTVRIRLVRIVENEFGELEEVSPRPNGRAMDFGPWDIELIGMEYFESFAFQLLQFRIPEPGEYELQLLVDDLGDDILYRERFYAVH